MIISEFMMNEKTDKFTPIGLKNLGLNFKN